MKTEKLSQTIAEIDRLNAEDPFYDNNDGKMIPKELLYSQRMSKMLMDYEPMASGPLQIATRAQHIQRWKIPRESYPMDRKGYLMWRTELKSFHGKVTSDLMEKMGYHETEIGHVDDLINKRRLKTDHEAQCLEDVVCLVFLKYYFDDFIEKHANEEDKIIAIVRKTWKKMSEKGHQAALNMSHSPKSLNLIKAALEQD
jgi:hypothetical protein